MCRSVPPNDVAASASLTIAGSVRSRQHAIHERVIGHTSTFDNQNNPSREESGFLSATHFTPGIEYGHNRSRTPPPGHSFTIASLYGSNPGGGVRTSCFVASVKWPIFRIQTGWAVCSLSKPGVVRPLQRKGPLQEGVFLRS